MAFTREDLLRKSEWLGLEPVSDEKRDELIEVLAQKVVKRRLETPAIWVLDAQRPVAVLVTPTLFFTAPLLGAFIGFQNANRWGRIWEDPENVKRLIARIELLSEQRKQAAKDARRKKS